jgi:hypothetical protein
MKPRWLLTYHFNIPGWIFPLKKKDGVATREKDWNWFMEKRRCLLTDYMEAEARKVLVKTEADNILKNHLHHHVRDCIAEGKLFILAEDSKDSLRLIADRIIVRNDVEGRLNLIKKINRCFRTKAIIQKSHGFTYNIPCGPEGNLLG